MHNFRTIILASASPRRKEILEKTGLKFKVDKSLLEENVIPGMKPREFARFLSREKAREVAKRHKNALVIAADTIILFRGKIFGKPLNRDHATEMLKALSGKVHSVITGFTIMDTADGKKATGTVETKVFFKRLSDEDIKAYVNSGEPMDKAGAYGIQGLGALLIKRIEGDFFNVAGLPLSTLGEKLKKFGISVLESNKVYY